MSLIIIYEKKGRVGLTWRWNRISLEATLKVKLMRQTGDQTLLHSFSHRERLSWREKIIDSQLRWTISGSFCVCGMCHRLRPIASLHAHMYCKFSIRNGIKHATSLFLLLPLFVHIFSSISFIHKYFPQIFHIRIDRTNMFPAPRTLRRGDGR